MQLKHRQVLNVNHNGGKITSNNYNSDHSDEFTSQGETKRMTAFITELSVALVSAIGAGLANFAKGHPEWIMSDFIQGLHEGLTRRRS